MSEEERRQAETDTATSYVGESDIDAYEDEEVPTVVLIVIGAIAIITVALYMTVAGGHNHFH